MADAINTFDASTQNAAAFGFEQPIKGDGYSLTHDPATSKWRADVWDGADMHRACPKLGVLTPEAAIAMGDKLVADFDRIRDPRESIKQMRDVYTRDRLEPGYARAVELRDALAVMHG